MNTKYIKILSIKEHRELHNMKGIKMTSQESYTISIRVKLEDRNNIDKLMKKGRTQVAVLRSGIATEMRKAGIK